MNYKFQITATKDGDLSALKRSFEFGVDLNATENDDVSHVIIQLSHVIIQFYHVCSINGLLFCGRVRRVMIG